ncbi:MAG: hypothetical protein KF802_10080 [Bdellovibrionaceae bacterium]|nr:hypothetical protein [Pseudobdellovibrionaceae bacterium]MBX3033759.1 hypothetical protein [Pseudobdellovibrionaceae bacterium]
MRKILSLLNNRSLSDRRGQVAIFIALIFQLLFLFFAMVVNVGLLVHHKINLQNSVDLAAYYGAMKQSEVMNAIAHTNYQIRQSYKLMTWRYRVLGTAGVFPTQVDPPGGHPTHKNSSEAVNSGRNGAVIRYSDEDGWPRENDKLKDFYERPAFCLGFKPFKEVPPGESSCRAPKGQKIDALRSAPIIAGYLGAAHVAKRVTELANTSKDMRCEDAGPFNYVALGRFIVGFNIDQGDRKMLIYKLANNMSQSTEDFIDIEGERASEGIRKTLDGNFTSANKESLKEFKIFNSLASGRCGNSGGNGSAPPGWLAEVSIFPRATYKMCAGVGGDSNLHPKNIDYRPSKDDGSGNPNVNNEKKLKPQIDYLEQYIALATPGSVFRPSLGVEKNPWCMSYVGVRAETEPSIPFSLGKIRLKAVAFAKPFGGRIGPWYGKKWQPGIMESSGSGEEERSDPRTPTRCAFGNISNCTVQGQDAVTTLNYSRFPGDPVGLMSRAIHGQYAKAIYDLGNPSLEAWEGIEYGPAARGGEWDLLSWGDEADKKMRRLEIASVVPDIFDLSYYSIDPDFYNNYFVGRLENYLKKHPISAEGGYIPRLDIGSRQSGDSLSGGRPSRSFNIKDQMDVAQSLQGSSNNGYDIDWSSKLMYAVVGSRNFEQVLTGWISKKDLTTYDLDTERFGRCARAAGKDAPVPGGCEHGGRTGYSVKLVSSDYLAGNHKLGGEGSSSARILNPPNEDFLK